MAPLKFGAVIKMKPWTYYFVRREPKDFSTFVDVGGKFNDLAAYMSVTLPDGRYKSLVLTCLEQAAMWASKSFTHGEG